MRVEMESVPADLDGIERRLEEIEIQRKSLEDDTDDESMHTSERARARSGGHHTAREGDA